MLRNGILLLSSLVLACTLTPAQSTPQVSPAATSTSGKIVAISHRGEHLHHPENTLPAFQAAIDAGADFFELDVRTTRDGKLILMHDSTADRTTNGTGPIKEMGFDQVRALDAGTKFSPQFAGTKVPTFEEALDLAHGKIGIYVDTKDADPKQLVDTIVQHDMQNHVVIYGNPFFLYEVQRIRPDLKIMPESYSADICKLLVRSMHLQVLAFSFGDFKEEVIQVAKQAGADIYVDRLGPQDQPESWQAAIDMGATGIQTDKPAELVQYLKSKGISAHR